jgi:hypothetical protein
MDQAFTQLASVTLLAMANEPLVQLRLVGLSDEAKQKWARDYWLAAPLQDGRMRSFALRELNSG